MRMKTSLLFAMALAALPVVADVEDLKLDYHGAGWLQIGRVEASYAPENYNNAYKKNWLGNSGGLLTVHTAIDEEWDAALGMGTILVHLARGSRNISNKWYPFWVSWVDEARVSHSGKLGSMDFKQTFGAFPVGYNGDIKNFGQYLLHGYVYPGAVATSFTGPLGVNQAISGVDVSLKGESFSNDFIVQLETSDMPLYDISVADIAAWRPTPAFEIGGGFNLYRVIANDPDKTSPAKDCKNLGLNANHGQPNVCGILDTSATGVIDTLTGSLAGVKLMGRFRLDPKALFGIESTMLGKNDLVLYSEFAVLGVKSYQQFYDKIAQRIPVMVGFNLPGFGFMDWSVEMEYYASKNSSDNLAAQSGSWVPAVDPDPKLDPKRDDFKWSINASKLVAGNMVVLAQVANDHLRLGGNHDEQSGIEAMRTPSDWYWTTKIAYFF